MCLKAPQEIGRPSMTSGIEGFSNGIGENFGDGQNPHPGKQILLLHYQSKREKGWFERLGERAGTRQQDDLLPNSSLLLLYLIMNNY